MNVSGLIPLLGLGQTPGPPGTQPDPRAQLFSTGGFVVIMLVVMYVLVFRPQQKKAKEHAELLKAVRAGDKVVTSGGVVGVVLSVKEKTFTIRSADAKFEVTKSAIAEITDRGGESSES